MAESGLLRLEGCTDEPLINYLKSLGIFRLLAEQSGRPVAGAWDEGVFCLRTDLDEADLVDFFVLRYIPSPVITPWNGKSGFWGGTQAIESIKDSTHPRLALYRETIEKAYQVIQMQGLKEKPSEADKAEMLTRMRSWLPEPAVVWIDALCVLADEKPVFAPVLGTGGNDGRLEFSVNFIQRLADVIEFRSSETNRSQAHLKQSQAWLRNALFGETGVRLARAAIGQFHPGGIGGANASQSFDGESLVNPWDFVLMIEGALMLAGSVARRAGREGSQRPAFPFTVNASSAGWDTVADADAETARRELWMPLWERSISIEELKHVLSEGRAQVGRRAASNGVDFARAVAGLGVDRGLSGFVRYGFVRRNGRAYIAAPLGRLAVRFNSDVHLIEEVDLWLERFRPRRGGDSTPGSVRRAYRKVQDAIYRFSQFGGKQRLQAVLAALGEAELLVASSRSLRESMRAPLQPLSLRWFRACDDGSPEFRLAASVASMYELRLEGVGGEDRSGEGFATMIAPSMRSHIEPVERLASGRWDWSEDGRSAVWGPGSLERNLIAVLQRRCMEAQQAGWQHPAPLNSQHPVDLSDIVYFLSNPSCDDAKIASLIVGLSLLRWERPRAAQQKPDGSSPSKPAPTLGERTLAQVAELSRVYALCKLVFHHISETDDDDANPLRVELSAVTRLASNDIRSAVQIVARRLRAAGFTLLGSSGARRFHTPDFPEIDDGARIAAALLFPIRSDWVLRSLVLRPPKDDPSESMPA